MEWQPTPVLFPGESHGQRSLAGYSPWGHKELDTTEQLSTAHSTWNSLLGFLKDKFTYLPTAGCAGSLVPLRLFSSCGEQGLLSFCGGLSHCRAPSLRRAGSVVAPGLQSTGSTVAAYRLSCSMACGIFPGHGSNLCLLCRQVDSSALSHQGSPAYWDFDWSWIESKIKLEQIDILVMCLLIYEDRISISVYFDFIRIFQFFAYRTCTYFVRVIPKYSLCVCVHTLL